MRNKLECTIIAKIRAIFQPWLLSDYGWQGAAAGGWRAENGSQTLNAEAVYALKNTGRHTIVSLTKSLLIAILKLAWWVSPWEIFDCFRGIYEEMERVEDERQDPLVWVQQPDEISKF